MILKYFFISILLANSLLLQSVNGEEECDDEEEEMCPCILLSITENSSPCSDVENKDIKMELKLNMEEGQENEPDMMKMDGYVELVKDAEGLEIWIDALMQTEIGEDPVFSCTADMCESMKDSDAPWYPIVQYFNTSSCPVPKKYYPIEGLRLNLDFANGVLTHDFCGAYNIKILLKKGIDTIFCILLGAEIYEAQKPCSECPSSGA